MEKKIECPHCNAKKQCFVEQQKTFESYMCFRCGFMSDSRYTKDSLEIMDLETRSPKLIKELKFFDEERLVGMLLTQPLIYSLRLMMIHYLAVNLR